MGFEVFVDEGSEFGKLIESFTFGDTVDFVGLLCLASNLICTASFWGVSFGVVVCLKISSKFMISCHLLAPIDANGAVGAGLAIASIKSSSKIFDAS